MPVNGTTYPSTGLECPVTLWFDPRNTSSFPASVIQTWISLSVISGIVAFPIFVINLLVIWTVLEKERLRSVIYNQLIAILSLTDLLTGLVVCPLFVAFNSCALVGCSSFCNLIAAYVVVGIVLTGWSNVTLMIISVERYLYIEHPLYYNNKVNSKKMMTVTAVAWLVVASLLIFAKLASDTSYDLRQVPAVVIFGGNVIIIFVCLTKVSRTTFRQMKAINAVQASVQGANANKIKESKRTITLGLVVLASVLFYCPLFIVRIVTVVKGNGWTNDFGYISQHVFVTFLHLQSLVNPMIFSLRLSYIRTGVLNKLFCRRRNDLVFIPKTNPANNREL